MYWQDKILLGWLQPICKNSLTFAKSQLIKKHFKCSISLTMRILCHLHYSFTLYAWDMTRCQGPSTRPSTVLIIGKLKSKCLEWCLFAKIPLYDVNERQSRSLFGAWPNFHRLCALETSLDVYMRLILWRISESFCWSCQFSYVPSSPKIHALISTWQCLCQPCFPCEMFKYIWV